MRYLVSVEAEHIEPGTEEVWAPAGEPVVPWYPATGSNVFLSTTSFKRSLYGEVVDTKLDPDDLAKELSNQYPGLPKELHENYVLAIAKFAARQKTGKKFRVMITQKSARLMGLHDDSIHILWEKQPMHNGDV